MLEKINVWMRRVLVLGLLLALLPGLGAGAALANAANPVRAGDLLGEPSGALKGMVIERERLLIDLRPLERRPATSQARAEGQPVALVQAEYFIRSTGARRKVALSFIANSLSLSAATPGEATSQSATGVWLDDRPVPFQPSSGEGLPGAWLAPKTTPAIADGSGAGDKAARGEGLPYEAEPVRTLDFSLDVAPGSHVLRVRYGAIPTALSSGSPTVFWQLGYVLAPARRWGGFGTLQVDVHVPENWRAASSLPLSRTGGLLTGAFKGVPADALALTVQAPPPAEPGYAVGAWLAGLVACWLGGLGAGRALGRRGWSSGWAIPLSLFLGLAWGVAVAAATSAEVNAVKDAAGAQAAWTYGYGKTMGAFFGIVGWLLVGLVLAQITAFVARRRTSRRLAQAARIESTPIPRP
jgi:hypothetical protein